MNLGTGRPVTVLDVGSALARGLDKEIAPEVTGKYRAGDIRHCFADVSSSGEAARLPGSDHSRGGNGPISSNGSRTRARSTTSTMRPASSSRSGWPADHGDAAVHDLASSSSRRTRRSGSSLASALSSSTPDRPRSTSWSPTTVPRTAPRELVETEFPAARVVTCENRGFSHANNQALLTCDARYVLFLNPDTEILDGTFGDLVAEPRRSVLGRPRRRPPGHRRRLPLSRRSAASPTPSGLSARLWARSGGRSIASWSGERELDLDVYDEEVPCDWTSGSFMLARREALAERRHARRALLHLLRGDRPLLRIVQAGWEVRHLPSMTILHHAAKGGVSERMTAQDAFARLQYGRKHFSPTHRVAYRGTIMCNYVLRALVPGSARAPGRKAARRALRILVGVESPPFGTPPPTALPPVPDDVASSRSVPVRLAAGAERS